MKIKPLIILLIILVLAVQPVSAGFFTDFFNKITGRTTDETATETTEETTVEGEPVQEPVQEEPVQEEPVREEPVQEEPVQEEPVREEPVEEEPVPPEEPVEEPIQEYPVQDIVGIPPDCHRIILDNGMEVIECAKVCPQVNPEAISRCEETGGHVATKYDQNGCSYMDCEYVSGGSSFGGSAECPSREELERIKHKCANAGLRADFFKEGNCEFVKCREEQAMPEVSCSETAEMTSRIKKDCEMKNGRIVKDFDQQGCPITSCLSTEGEIACERNIPKEAYNQCEHEGGNLVVKRDNEGCIRFADCIRRGQREITYEEVNKVPPIAKLLSIALKLETLKVEFDKLARKVRGIAEYYEDTDNMAEADKFRRVAGIFSGAIEKIDALKVKIRDKAKGMTIDDLREIKHDVKYITEVVMQDALYIILGGEITLEGSSGITEEGYTKCGEDDRCWAEALRLCEPVVHTPSGAEITAYIHGLDGEVCIIEAHHKELSMVCKVEEYATMSSSGPEILQYCEGDLVELLKQHGRPSDAEKVEPSRIKEKVIDIRQGIKPPETMTSPIVVRERPAVICGDGLCERFRGENEYDCPDDCKNGEIYEEAIPEMVEEEVIAEDTLPIASASGGSGGGGSYA